MARGAACVVENRSDAAQTATLSVQQDGRIVTTQTVPGNWYYITLNNLTGRYPYWVSAFLFFTPSTAQHTIIASNTL